jgi:hypothetical protein
VKSVLPQLLGNSLNISVISENYLISILGDMITSVVHPILQINVFRELVFRIHAFNPLMVVKGTNAGSRPRLSHCCEVMAQARSGLAWGSRLGSLLKGGGSGPIRVLPFSPGVINASYITSFHPRPSVRGEEP